MIHKEVVFCLMQTFNKILQAITKYIVYIDGRCALNLALKTNLPTSNRIFELIRKKKEYFY